MTSRLLYRIEGIDQSTAITPAMVAALLTHITHVGLTCVLLQVGTQQQAYLALDGCAGCVVQRCRPGCPRDLWCRALAHHLPAAQLHLVPGGLRSYSYQHVVLATPRAAATPLNADVLSTLDDARLVVQWRTVRGQIHAGALLAANGGDLPALVRSRGWQTRHGFGVRRLTQAAIPAPLTVLGPWQPEPYLLLAQPATPAGNDPDDATLQDANINEALAARLIAQIEPLLVADSVADAAFFRQSFGEQALVLGGEPASHDPTEVAVLDPPDVSIWPAGPGRMRPSQVGFLIEQIRTSPIVQGGTDCGVTRRRIAQLLPEDLAEYSRQLMVWLDQAGALTPPSVPDEPFRNPRQLSINDDATLAAALHATPVPDAETARACTQ